MKLRKKENLTRQRFHVFLILNLVVFFNHIIILAFQQRDQFKVEVLPYKNVYIINRNNNVQSIVLSKSIDDPQMKEMDVRSIRFSSLTRETLTYGSPIKLIYCS
jgi:hypothetical protein